MSENIYDKIIKLLRLAERATGPEAELALSRAQKLATIHQVDLATMDTTEGERERKEEFLKDEVEYSEKSLAVYIQWLLQNHFRVQTCYNSRVVYFVGRKSDVVFAQYLFGWLQDRFISEWREEKKKPHHGGGRRSAKSFFYGMYLGLDEKLKAAKKQAEESKLKDVAMERQEQRPDFNATQLPGEVEPKSDALREVTSTYQLAIINEKDELQKEYERRFPHVRSRSSSMSSARGKGMAAGRAAGQRTSIPGLPLNNSTRSQLS